MTLENSDWLGANDSDDLISNEDALFMRFDASEGGLFNGHFVPPPPRPFFLDDSATPDGLTTCDLCSWAWQESKSFTLDQALEAPGEIGWMITLIIVSLVSALIGAIVMIVVLHCRRLKNAENDVNDRGINLSHRDRPAIHLPTDKSFSPNDDNHHIGQSSGVWSWLSRRTPNVTTQLDTPTAPVENHYTHMEEHYGGIPEALYTELDKDGADSPAYQNSAYTDPDAPSSAYYSDLSIGTGAIPERAYEVVGLATLAWVGDKRIDRLSSISETVPSDYV